jgi:hypothetical protein
MATFVFSIQGRPVRFSAMSLAQAKFARDKHIEFVRQRDRERKVRAAAFRRVDAGRVPNTGWGSGEAHVGA